jgi:Ran GTPase-activating protein (RanGAP) involved in mRNA processing and transport
VLFLKSLLAKLPNLRKIKFSEDKFPKAFEEIQTRIRSATIDKENKERNEGIEHIIGTDILMQALAQSQIAVKKLSIPVAAFYCQSIVMHDASSETLSQVLTNTETLKLHLSRSQANHGILKETMLTDANAPKLRELEWTSWCAQPVDAAPGRHPLTFWPTKAACPPL